MLKSLLSTSLLLQLLVSSCAQQGEPAQPIVLSSVPSSDFVQDLQSPEQPSQIVDFDAFMTLAAEVQTYRKDRLVKLDRFLELAKQPNTIILDTRSQHFFELKHLKGAKNLAFSDFTMKSLGAVIPDQETTILIYCNNNFSNDKRAFPSKVSLVDTKSEGKKPISLALNIPTFINLYGYGYRNVFELESLISVFDSRVQFESGVIKTDPEKG